MNRYTYCVVSFAVCGVDGVMKGAFKATCRIVFETFVVRMLRVSST
jgi:hypothetical protein